ncbi:MAG: pseudouridine synthase [Candidatus Kapabacteria bacterium]|nr:pseudouridine synthase [Candidatus Kapabacteria bacterium]
MIIAFNKPYGVLSQFTPEPGSSYRTLSEFDFPQDVYPVGRLDADSEGLLLLTDEKGLVAQLLEPEQRHERTYWVQVEGVPQEADLHRLRQGVTIRTWKTLPCRVQITESANVLPARVPPIRERKNIPTSWLEITLYEGKNRQVRRMTAQVGFPTLRLIRVSNGGLRLVDLRLDVGTWRELTSGERALLLQR